MRRRQSLQDRRFSGGGLPIQNSQRVPGHPDGASCGDGNNGAENDSAKAEMAESDEDEAESDVGNAGDENGEGEGADFSDGEQDGAADGAAAADDRVNEHERENGTGIFHAVAEPEMEEPWRGQPETGG